MSTIYHTEPPTNGKVILQTTFGEIDIELWSKEAPLACRNFLQLSLEGYYDQTEVVRVVKGFMVQMGDPTGTGFGGESIWGKPFKDEVHGRIKFNHRGLVAMANSNKPNSNQSQFFITLDSCDWLNGKHTIFGKVTGNTIFNLLRMGEVDVDQNERPTDSIKLLRVTVLSNPFEDIVPRSLKKLSAAQAESEKPQRKEKAVKNANLLSFDDEEQEGDEDVAVKFKSLRDMRSQRESKKTNKIEKKDKPLSESNENKEQKSNQTDRQRIQLSLEKEKEQQLISDEEILNPLELVESVQAEQNQKLILQANQEFKRLKENLKGDKGAIGLSLGSKEKSMVRESTEDQLVSALESRRLKHVKRKQNYGDREEETMKKLKRFTDSLKQKKQSSVARESNNNNTGDDEAEDYYHGQVLEPDDNQKDDLSDWFVGKLKCKKHIDEQYRNN